MRRRIEFSTARLLPAAGFLFFTIVLNGHIEKETRYENGTEKVVQTPNQPLTTNP